MFGAVGEKKSTGISTLLERYMRYYGGVPQLILLDLINECELGLYFLAWDAQVGIF